MKRALRIAVLAASLAPSPLFAQPTPAKPAAPRVAMVPQIVHVSDAQTKLRFSPDGRLLASAHRGKIHLWDIATGALLRILAQPGVTQYHDLRFLPDGKRLLSANFDLAVTTWDLETGEPIHLAPGMPFGGSGFFFSGNGRRALWLELDGYLRIADLTPSGRAQIPKILHTVGGTGPKGVTVAMTQKLAPGGTLLGGAISKSGDVGVIARGSGPPEVWNLDRGELFCKLDKKTPVGVTIALSPDGERIVTSFSNGSLRVLDAKRCSVLREFARPPEPIRSIAFTEELRKVIVIDAKQITIFDIESGRVSHTLPQPRDQAVNEAAAAAGGTIALGGNGVLMLWEPATGALRSLTRDKAALSPVQSVAFDATGRRAASATFDIKSPILAAWDLNRLALSAVAPLDAGTAATVVLASRSPRAWSLSSFDKRLRAWDLGPFLGARHAAPAAPLLLAAFDGSQGEAGLAVAASGRRALTVTTRVTQQMVGGKPVVQSELDLGLWGDDKSITPKAAVQKDYGRPLAISGDGRFAATSRMDASARKQDVMLWDLSRGTLLHAIAADTLHIWSAAFSPDGKTFAFNDIVPGTFGDSRIRIIDVAGGNVVRTIKGGFSAAYAMTFSDDGKRIAAGYGDRVTRIWSADTGALLTTRPLEGHTQYVRATAFSPDGKYLLTGSEDGTLRLHRIDNGAAVSLIARGDDWLVYSDDGYFDASRKGGSLVAATSGLRPFRVDQLAVRNNRPDLLLSRMGLGTPELIEHYRLRYERRLKKLNIKSDAADVSFEKAPAAKITGVVEKGGALDVTFDIEGIGADLLRYNVFVNDVPLFGALGKETSGRQQRITERVLLGEGRNKIEVSALDAAGAESLRAFIAPPPQPKRPGDLYYLGFGVSKYKNPKYNLGYPHKDVLDVGEVLKSAKGQFFRDVHVAAFVNEQVTVDAVRGAKEFLSRASIHDTVVLFVAGHGLHAPGPAADYYFATHETDVKHLPETAARFEVIEDILQGIAPRKKLFLMDTCESGEAADGEDQDEKPGAGMLALGGAEGRGLRARTTRALSLDVGVEVQETAPFRAHVFDRDRYVYNDLSRRSGAVVLSSSRGSELSYELDELQNGVFSEAILIALTSDRADIDKDGQVSVDELRDFVISEVPKRTWNRQHPTVDRDNLEVQFGFPVMADAASIASRGDPTAAGSRSRGIASSAPEPSPNAPPKTQVPPGCGCELPQESHFKWDIAGAIAALLGLTTARRRSRRT